MTTSTDRRKGPRTWGSVRKLPSKKWQARTAPDGQGRRIAIGIYNTKADANAALATAQRDAQVGAFVSPGAGEVTFRDQSEKWLATVTLRPSARARDESYLRSKILPTLGERQLGQIDAALLRKWIAACVLRASRRRPWSSPTRSPPRSCGRRPPTG